MQILIEFLTLCIRRGKTSGKMMAMNEYVCLHQFSPLDNLLNAPLRSHSAIEKNESNDEIEFSTIRIRF